LRSSLVHAGEHSSSPAASTTPIKATVLMMPYGRPSAPQYSHDLSHYNADFVSGCTADRPHVIVSADFSQGLRNGVGKKRHGRSYRVSLPPWPISPDVHTIGLVGHHECVRCEMLRKEFFPVAVGTTIAGIVVSAVIGVLVVNLVMAVSRDSDRHWPRIDSPPNEELPAERAG